MKLYYQVMPKTSAAMFFLVLGGSSSVWTLQAQEIIARPPKPMKLQSVFENPPKPLTLPRDLKTPFSTNCEPEVSVYLEGDQTPLKVNRMSQSGMLKRFYLSAPATDGRGPVSLFTDSEDPVQKGFIAKIAKLAEWNLVGDVKVKCDKTNETSSAKNCAITEISARSPYPGLRVVKLTDKDFTGSGAALQMTGEGARKIFTDKTVSDVLHGNSPPAALPDDLVRQLVNGQHEEDYAEDRRDQDERASRYNPTKREQKFVRELLNLLPKPKDQH